MITREQVDQAIAGWQGPYVDFLSRHAALWRTWAEQSDSMVAGKQVRLEDVPDFFKSDYEWAEVVLGPEVVPEVVLGLDFCLRLTVVLGLGVVLGLVSGRTKGGDLRNLFEKGRFERFAPGPLGWVASGHSSMGGMKEVKDGLLVAGDTKGAC
jgi:hypothetical protein